MKRIIGLLEEKGMRFDVDGNTRELANKYIKYNTSWNMLKQSRNLLYLNTISKDKYLGTSFFELRTAGMVHFYFNKAIEIVVKEFEHCLKVYMSNMFESASHYEREKIIKRLQYMQFNYNKSEININIENVFEVYSFATLRELIQIYKIMKGKIKSLSMPKIDGKISNIRNTIYHHNNILIENKPNENSNIDKIHIAEIESIGLSYESIEYLGINYQYNTLRLIIDMMNITNYFLSQDECTSKRRKYMFENFEKDLKKSNYYYDKLKPKQWVKIYYESLYKVLSNL